MPVSLGKSIISFGFEERPRLRNMIESDEGGHLSSTSAVLYKLPFPNIHLTNANTPYKIKVIYIPISSYHHLLIILEAFQSLIL